MDQKQFWGCYRCSRDLAAAKIAAVEKETGRKALH